MGRPHEAKMHPAQLAYMTKHWTDLPAIGWAKHYEVNRSTIVYHARRRGLTVLPRGRQPAMNAEQDAELSGLWAALSFPKLATHFKVSVGQIRRAGARLGLPDRGVGRPRLYEADRRRKQQGLGLREERRGPTPRLYRCQAVGCYAIFHAGEPHVCRRANG